MAFESIDLVGVKIRGFFAPNDSGIVGLKIPNANIVNGINAICGFQVPGNRNRVVLTAVDAVEHDPLIVCFDDLQGGGILFVGFDDLGLILEVKHRTAG